MLPNSHIGGNLIPLGTPALRVSPASLGPQSSPNVG